METTLFDDTANPVAYFTDGPDRVIYRFSGAAMAFITGENVFAWNGAHLGWYIDGVLYNLGGAWIATVKEKVKNATQPEPDKFKKYERQRRLKARDTKPKPPLGKGYGQRTFEDFLRGIV